MEVLRLRDLKTGQQAKVRSMELDGSMRRRLRDIGLIEDTPVECLGVSSGGSPKAFLIRGIALALRAEDSGGIWVERI
ncbi:MAG: ferrous iron transport protein A [Oscillospiraceae bacterium]|nr:ferrous iron transport protein A [Oscillospiraceae bacterium]